MKFYWLSGATIFYDCITIYTIYQFIKPFLANKMSILEKYGAFNSSSEKISEFMYGGNVADHNPDT